MPVLCSVSAPFPSSRVLLDTAGAVEPCKGQFVPRLPGWQPSGGALPVGGTGERLYSWRKGEAGLCLVVLAPGWLQHLLPHSDPPLGRWAAYGLHSYKASRVAVAATAPLADTGSTCRLGSSTESDKHLLTSSHSFPPSSFHLFSKILSTDLHGLPHC